MNAIETVLLASEHLSAAAELEALCFSEPWSANALASLIRDMGIGIAALSPTGDLLGYGGMVIAPDEGQITNVAVHPNARRQGVGREILLRLIEEARSKGLEQISLEVRASNAPAISLYLSHGFTVEGTRKNFYRRPTEDGLVMIKRI